MAKIKFKISVRKEDVESMIDALNYHDQHFEMKTQENKKHFLFSFSIDPMGLFDLGGTVHEYKRIIKQREISKRC